MKCPYVTETKTEIQAWNQTPDENGNYIKGVTSLNTSYKMQDCLKEECGAYKDGKCCYNQ